MHFLVKHSALILATLSTLALGGEPPIPTLSTYQLMYAGAPENEAYKDFLREVPKDAHELAGKRIAVVSTDGVEAVELSGPINYLRARGAEVHLVSPHKPELPAKYGVQYPAKRKTHILTVRFMENASWQKIDRFLGEAKASDYDAAIVPGGAWNPDALRGDSKALDFLRELDREGKIVAAICHGPLVLIDAGLIKGRKATSYWNVQIDIRNAGANVIDRSVVRDGNLITSRFPYDLPDFMATIRQALLR